MLRRSDSVFTSLQRVSEIYCQLRSEVSDLGLVADVSSDLVQHMLQLQAEGLPAAAGDDPLQLLLAAREAQFTATMQVSLAALAMQQQQQQTVPYQHSNV